MEMNTASSYIYIQGSPKAQSCFHFFFKYIYESYFLFHEKTQTFL